MVKCKCGETRIECFSNPEKEKRCRECVKAAKNSANKKDQVVDTETTVLSHSNWQGGKYAGTIFQRTGDENGLITCVAGKQKRFRCKLFYGRRRICIRSFETKTRRQIIFFY